MNSNRLPVVGLIIAIVVAIFALIQQQQAVNDLRTAVTNVASADAGRVTAVAMMQEAASTQVQAEIGQATALAAAAQASTAQATAQAAAGTAAVQLQDEGTRGANVLATNDAEVASIMSTSQAQRTEINDIIAEMTVSWGDIIDEAANMATIQANTISQLGTATAQVDLAEFARQAAEDDRTNALNQLWAVSTAQAETRAELATAYAILTGEPPTSIPSPTVAAQSTEAANLSPTGTPAMTADVVLANTFTSTDGKIEIRYPEGWFAQEFRSGTVVIVNQEELFNRTESALAPGQVEVDILVGSYEDYGIEPGTAPLELLTVIVENLQSRQSNFEYGEVAAFTASEYPAARVYANDGDNDITIYAVQLSETALSVVYGLAAEGEGQDSMYDILGIVSTIRFTE